MPILIFFGTIELVGRPTTQTQTLYCFHAYPDITYVTSHVKMSPMLANIKSELIPYLERVSFQLSNDVSFMFLGGFTHE